MIAFLYFTYKLVSNLFIGTLAFFQSFVIQKYFLISIEMSHALFKRHYFIPSLEEKSILIDFSLLFSQLLWKILFGILLIIPILLIVAYSTLLE